MSGERSCLGGGGSVRLFAVGLTLLGLASSGGGCVHIDARETLRRCVEAHRRIGCFSEHELCVKDFGQDRCDKILRVWVGDRFNDVDEVDDAGRPIMSP
jgi:hypothetical protein